MASPFAHLLVSNQAPTEEEALRIREIIRQYEIQLDVIRITLNHQLSFDHNLIRPPSIRKNVSIWRRLRTRIMPSRYRKISELSALTDKARSRLPELLRDRDKIRHLLSSHRALLSPMRRIPPELWSEIFAFCTPNQPFLSPTSSQAPLLICQVCRYWRDIAISTPCIWASLSLSIFRRGVSGPERSLTPANTFLATTWLSRSQSYPLSLEISWYPVASSMDALLDVILSHFHRLRHLRLYVPCSALDRMLNNPGVPLPLLQSLEIVTHANLSATNHYTVSRTATALCTLIIPTIYVNPLALDIAWSQLTSLRSHYCLNTQNSIELISRCTNLSECTMRIDWSAPPDSTQAAPQVLLPRLCALSITSESCLRFLNHLTLPSLQDITITVVRGRPGVQPPSWLMATLRRMVERSSCSLTRLRILDSSINDGDPVYEEDLLYFLQDVPSVTDVEAVFNGRDQIRGRVFEVLSRRRFCILCVSLSPHIANRID